MASRWVATAALAGVSAITAVCVSPPEAAYPPPAEIAATRQISDAEPVPGVRIAAPAATPPAAAATATAPPPSPFDLDIPELTIAFGHAELDTLVTTGTATVSIPGHADIDLHLTRHYSRHGMQHISASHAGLISTFTRRGERFFATLATPFESYRLESTDGGDSRIIPQRLLAARTIRHEKDFRHAH